MIAPRRRVGTIEIKYNPTIQALPAANLSKPISTQTALIAIVKMAVYCKEINPNCSEINADCSATNPNRKEINAAYAEMADEGQRNKRGL